MQLPSLLKNIHIYMYTTYLPTYLPTYLHTYLPADLPTCLPTYLHTYLPAYLPTCIPTYLSTLPSIRHRNTLTHTYICINMHPQAFFAQACCSKHLTIFVLDEANRMLDMGWLFGARNVTRNSCLRRLQAIDVHGRLACQPQNYHECPHSRCRTIPLIRYIYIYVYM